MTRAPIGTWVGGTGVLSCIGNQRRGWGWGCGSPSSPPFHEGSPHPPRPEGGGQAVPTAPRGQRHGALPGSLGTSPKPVAGCQHTPLTVLARVALGAGAAVLVGLGVDARAPVGARVVAATVVQVWGQGQGPQMPGPPLAPHLPQRASSFRPARHQLPLLQSRPPQLVSQLHCQGSTQLPCTQPGYGTHSSQNRPCQP